MPAAYIGRLHFAFVLPQHRIDLRLAEPDIKVAALATLLGVSRQALYRRLQLEEAKQLTS